jgi:rhomboid family GlyGly-CTERM serine protease
VSRPTRGQQAWLQLCALLALLALALWFAPRQTLDWEPALALSQPWRAWSAAFVHWSAWHLGANLLGCVVVAAFGSAAAVPSSATWAWLAAWPLTHAALALQPALTRYGGLSGVLHAGVAIAAWHLIRHAQGRRRAVGVAVLGGLAIKLLAEQPWGAPLQLRPEWDFPVAPLAHASGVLTGLLCASLGQWWERRA